MQSKHSAISSAMAGIAIIVVLIVAGVAGYEAGASGKSSSGTVTSTLTSTEQVGTATTTVTSTTTVGSGGATVTVSGAGGTSTVTSTTTETTTALEDLAAAAETECPPSATTCLTIDSTQAATLWNTTYGPLFDALFPWATGKVVWNSVSSSTEAAQVISQYQAGKVTADIVTGSAGVVIPVGSTGALMNYTSPLIPFMNYSSGDYGSNWVADNRAIIDVVYNPQVLQAKGLSLPTTYAQLGSSSYKGLLAFATPSSLGQSGSLFYYLYTTMGNSSWTALMQQIAANDPIITTSSATAEQDVINGQAAIAIGTFDDYVTDAQNSSISSNIKLVNLEPFLYTPGVISIANGAPHPLMAELVESWFISVSGQQGIVNGHHDPYMTSLSGPLVAYLPTGYTMVNAYANTAIVASTNASGEWSDIFNNLFG